MVVFFINFVSMTNLKLFGDSEIRSLWNEEEQEWYFAVVAVLTDSLDAKDYWYRMKKRESFLGSSYR
jgi:hypothetical protein